LPVDKDYLILKRASASRSSGEWSDDDYDVLADGIVVGRIFMPEVLPGLPWMWTLIFPYHEIAAPPTAMQRAGRTPWAHSPRAGGGNNP
jgi:hypothetical protein